MHKTYSLASSVYGTGRGLAPTRLDGKVRAVEDKPRLWWRLSRVWEIAFLSTWTQG